jgi:hypothetical protein
MRPFNIDLWKAGEPVITRDGREVEELTYFESKKGPYKLCGTLNGLLESWTIDGFFQECKSESNDDLFHPEPEMWVNVYDRKNGLSQYGLLCGEIHRSKDEAEKNIVDRYVYIGTYKLVKP